jgi:hypothetical protein
MNVIKLALPLLLMLALGFVLGGCPKDKMMQNDHARPAVQQLIG